MPHIVAGTLEARRVKDVFVDGVQPKCPFFGTAVVYALNAEEGWVDIYLADKDPDKGEYDKQRLYGVVTYTIDEDEPNGNDKS